MEKVINLGGNQYEVTIGDETRIIDMDGITAVSNEDYDRLEEEGLADNFYAPIHSTGDEFWGLALQEMLNYSEFDVEEYIKENK